MQELLPLKQKLLTQIKSYYSKVNSTLERQIVGLEVADKFFGANKESFYRIDLLLKTNDKRPYLGPGYSVIKQLEAQFHVKVDFWYMQGKQPVRI